MSTRSMIGKMAPDGSVEAIYCHFDGCPAGVGRTLLDYYYGSSVDELISLGDISSLGRKPISAPELWSRDSWTLGGEMTPSYKDRGESGCEARTYSDDEAYVTAALYRGAEFIYLLCDGEWLVSEGAGWKRLDDELEG